MQNRQKYVAYFRCIDQGIAEKSWPCSIDKCVDFTMLNAIGKVTKRKCKSGIMKYVRTLIWLADCMRMWSESTQITSFVANVLDL